MHPDSTYQGTERERTVSRSDGSSGAERNREVCPARSEALSDSSSSGHTPPDVSTKMDLGQHREGAGEASVRGSTFEKMDIDHFTATQGGQWAVLAHRAGSRAGGTLRSSR
jgi:hypothetical protein